MSDTLEQITGAPQGGPDLTQKPEGAENAGKFWVVKHKDGSLSYYPSSHAQDGMWIPFPTKAAALQANDMQPGEAQTFSRDAINKAAGASGKAANTDALKSMFQQNQSLSTQQSSSIRSEALKYGPPGMSSVLAQEGDAYNQFYGLQGAPAGTEPSLLAESSPGYQFSNPKRKRKKTSSVLQG